MFQLQTLSRAFGSAADRVTGAFSRISSSLSRLVERADSLFDVYNFHTDDERRSPSENTEGSNPPRTVTVPHPLNPDVTNVPANATAAFRTLADMADNLSKLPVKQDHFWEAFKALARMADIASRYDATAKPLAQTNVPSTPPRVARVAVLPSPVSSSATSSANSSPRDTKGVDTTEADAARIAAAAQAAAAQAAAAQAAAAQAAAAQAAAAQAAAAQATAAQATAAQPEADAASAAAASSGAFGGPFGASRIDTTENVTFAQQQQSATARKLVI